MEEGQRPKFSKVVASSLGIPLAKLTSVNDLLPPVKCPAAGRFRREMVNLVRVIR